MGGVCNAYWGGEWHVQGLVRKPEGDRPLGRPRRRWGYNIKMDLQEVGCVGMQVAGTCECGNELSGSIKCGEFLD
jgi:hypothetical protein